jgi:hypothetical protein
MKPNHSHVAIWLATILLATSGCSRNGSLTKTEAKTEEIMAQEVPLGSDAAMVFAFLDGRRLQHSEVVDLPAETLARPGGDTFFWNTKLDGKRDRIRRYISAKIPKSSGKGIFATWDMVLRFYLDADGKVVAYQAEKIGTSF